MKGIMYYIRWPIVHCLFYIIIHIKSVFTKLNWRDSLKDAAVCIPQTANIHPAPSSPVSSLSSVNIHTDTAHLTQWIKVNV